MTVFHPSECDHGFCSIAGDVGQLVIAKERAYRAECERVLVIRALSGTSLEAQNGMYHTAKRVLYFDNA